MSKSSQSLEKLRDLPDVELRAQLATTRDDLFRLRLGQYTNQVTSTAELQTKRRDVARMMTILRSRVLGSEKQAEGTSSKTEAAATDAAAPTKKKSSRKAKAE